MQLNLFQCFFADNGRKDLGESCGLASECSDTGAGCTEAKCTCMSSYFKRGGRCPMSMYSLLIPEKAIFFYFLVYGSSDPNFCILEKKKKYIFDFFIFSDVKKCQI